MKLNLPREARSKRLTVPTLRVVAGPDMLRFTSLCAGEDVVIGRDERGDLILTHSSVSRYHTRVTCSPTGEVTVQDLGSTNGTSVNGQGTRRALLRPGDHLEIGAVSLRLDMLGLDELAHLARVQERLSAADRDPLTGMLNRSWLEEQLPALLERCADAEVPITSVFVDVDHFKAINDTYGHAVGDEVLQGVCRLLMLGVRDTDASIRYGGEEFLLILPGAEEAKAQEVAERLRRSVSGHDWDRTSAGLRVTASFGLAQRLEQEPITTWLSRADQAMYAAKGDGRNRVRQASALGKPPSR
jgi:diguanylate cyclase (GGDEF)-like protein